jgi:hypothetical protein
MLLLAALLAACASILSVPLYGLLQTGGRSAERNRYVSANNIVNAIAILVASAIVTLALGLGLRPSDILIGFALPLIAMGAGLAWRRSGDRN